jgi:hypothetical protein
MVITRKDVHFIGVYEVYKVYKVQSVLLELNNSEVLSANLI